MKRFRKKMLLIASFFLLSWLIFAQSCLTFRKSDKEQKSVFAKRNVILQTGSIQVDGKNIHFALTGRDTLPTIYFIHGSPGSWDAFSEYMQDSQLLQKFRMVSVDRPGFGFSDFGQAEHLDVQSHLISPLFNHLANHRPVFLAGHSMGGPMVIKLGADNPGLISGIVVISGSIDPAQEEPEKWRFWLYKTPLNFFVPGALRPSNEELWYLKKDLIPLAGDFAGITCSVYFIHGEEDTWVPPANVIYGRKMLRNSVKTEVTMIPGANHFIPWTKFSIIRDVLLKLY
jgi:pimeloyl-ACP methyl ester carboxylesterase